MMYRTKRSNKASIIAPSVALRLLLTVVAAWFTQQAVAQNYPNGLIRIIVPYAAGGVTNSLARIVAAQFADAVGQPVVVENRPGASSMLGMQACANAKPDGYTICVAVADSLSYNPQLFASLPYDPEKSFAPVIRLALTNNLLVANSTSPFNNYKEFVAYARANPGKLNWATWGPATLPDLYLRWVSMQAGVKIQAIPYKGGAAQANPAVYSGEADITYMGFGTAAPQIEAGAIKPLVAVEAERSAFMPELPCLRRRRWRPWPSGLFRSVRAGRHAASRSCNSSMQYSRGDRYTTSPGFAPKTPRSSQNPTRPTNLPRLPGLTGRPLRRFSRAWALRHKPHRSRKSSHGGHS